MKLLSSANQRQMSGFTLPRFAKTNGKTSKFSESGQSVDSPSTRSPSFFKTLKSKLKRTSRSMGSRSFDDDDDDDKSYFSKTGGGSTAKNISAFAWVRTDPRFCLASKSEPSEGSLKQASRISQFLSTACNLAI